MPTDRVRRKPLGSGKKHTGWSYWNGNVWIRLTRGQLGRIRGLGYRVRRDV
jgi:hypothetical protein